MLDFNHDQTLSIMNTKLNYKIFLICTLPLFFTCSDEFVTKEFKNGVVDENFFKNATHAEQALTAVYDIISEKGMYREAINMFGDCPSDDINELTGDNGDYGTHFKAASDFRWTPDNNFSVARWYDGYKGIFRANILLEKLPDIDMDASLAARFAGEAKFLRALFYFNLVVAFGDVPFVTSVLTRDEYSQLARTDKSIIYAQMEQDLRDAAAVLPVAAGDPVGRATKGAANGLLSRIYLYQNKWQDAAGAAKQVIDQGTYDLVSSEDYVKIFNGQMENSVESIMEFQAVGLAPGFWANSENFYSIMWSPLVGWANWFSPSPGSYQQFEAGDIRRKASVLVVNADPPDSIDVDGDGIQDHFPSGSMNTNYFNGANVRKWLPEGKNMSVADNFDVNFHIIRYAEILLNHAEAENELGNASSALASVNLLRTRAKVPEFTETDQAALRQLIREERRRELLFEGHRYHDLHRWGIAAQVLGPLGYVVGRHEYWPVPVAELDLMPNLTQYPE
jgi:hypothetical protein